MAVEWSLLIYSVLVGIAIGPFAVMALTGCIGSDKALCKWGSALGLAAMALGGIAAFTHLKAPGNVTYIFTNLGSAMGLEMLGTVVTGLIAALFAAQVWFDLWPGGRRIVAWLGLAASVISTLLLGHMYMLPARPMWNTWLLPLTFLTTSVVAGLVVMIVLVSLLPAEDEAGDRMALIGKLSRWLLGALVVNGVVALAYFLASGAGSRLISGDMALSFWLGLVAVGIVLPIAAVWFSSRPSPEPQRVQVLMALNLVMVLASAVAVRVMIFGLGTTVNLLAG